MQPAISVWKNRTLIWRLARREIEARFRGSFLGLFWAVIAPLAMLGVYSLVFGSLLEARWARPEPTAPQAFSFPMLLFLGLIMFGILSEPLNRAPGLILENVSYVKKVVFPLEILPVVSLITALVNATISFAMFLVVYVLFYGPPPVTALLLPLAVLPLWLVTLGLVYLLSSLGVFLRDLGHVVPLLTTSMLFLSSVFFPPEAMPEHFRPFLYLNPITTAVNHARDLVFWGTLPHPAEWLTFFLACALVFAIGAFWFMRTEKAFADVL